MALREARQALGQTQGEVAEAMEWSLSKVQRIEKGDVTVAPNDLRPLLAHLQIHDRGQVDALLQAAKTSRQRRQWWDESRWRDNVTPSMLQLASFEADARSIYYYSPFWVPGILQIPAYVDAMLGATFWSELPNDVRAVRGEFRRRRRQEVFSRSQLPSLFLLMDESALYRHFGEPQMLGEQLADLLRLAESGVLEIRIVPLDIKENVVGLGAFDIHDLGGEPSGEDQNSVIYRESAMIDEIVDDVVSVARHRRIFSRLWDVSIEAAKSLELIEGRVGFYGG